MSSPSQSKISTAFPLSIWAWSQLLIQRDYTGNVSINIEHCWQFIELFPVLFSEKNNSQINMVNSL